MEHRMADTGISLCMIVRNGAATLDPLLERVGTIAQEIFILDQNSTDKTVQIAKRHNARVITSTPKGYADPDRQYCYDMASGPWILAMDPDEELDSTLLAMLPDMAKDNTIDCYWFAFRNEVNGVDISDILGPDPHPRLWRKLLPDGNPNMQWPHEAHQFPLIRSPRVCYIEKGQFIHRRTLDQIEASHEARREVISPQAREVEDNFLKQVRERVGSRIESQPSDKTPNSPDMTQKRIGKTP